MATKPLVIGGDRTQISSGRNGGEIRAVVNIKPPNFRSAIFKIVGIAPLVIHRFSAKTKAQMKEKMETGKAASSKKNREPKSTDDTYQESRYISKQGWVRMERPVEYCRGQVWMAWFSRRGGAWMVTIWSDDEWPVWAGTA